MKVLDIPYKGLVAKPWSIEDATAGADGEIDIITEADEAGVNRFLDWLCVEPLDSCTANEFRFSIEKVVSAWNPDCRVKAFYIYSWGPSRYDSVLAVVE